MAATSAAHVRTARIAVGLLLGTGVIALSLAAARVTPGEELFTHYATLTGFITHHRMLALALFAGAYIVIIALCLPGNIVMALLAGVLFGGLAGGTVAVLSATIGGVIFFAAARAGFAESVARRAPARIATIADGFRRDGFFYLLFLRVTPVFPFFVVNIAAALCDIKLIVFAAATLIGIAPVTFSYAFAAAGLEHAIARQADMFVACKAAAQTACPILSPLDLIGADFLLPLSALGILSILPVIVRRLVPKLRRPA